jgi:hypothetical protein
MSALVRSYKMKNITEIIEPITGEVVVLIDRGNGEFTSMLKSTYEAQQVEHLTEIPTK